MSAAAAVSDFDSFWRVGVRLIAILLAVPVVGGMLFWGWVQRKREDRPHKPQD